MTSVALTSSIHYDKSNQREKHFEKGQIVDNGSTWGGDKYCATLTGKTVSKSCKS